MKKIAIVQSCYIPWKGYFDIINSADEFILLDDVQYTRRDWRNRNLIKTPQGLIWLSIPVLVKGKYFQKIEDTKINDFLWPENHWKTIISNYSKAPFFNEYKEIFKEAFHKCRNQEYLSLVNLELINVINMILEIKTRITWSRDYKITPTDKTMRLVELCKAAKGSLYISGPSAKNYLNENHFKTSGIAVDYVNYSDYPIYNQLYQGFEHGISIIDLIFNEGPNAKKFMKSFTNSIINPNI